MRMRRGSFYGLVMNERERAMLEALADADGHISMAEVIRRLLFAEVEKRSLKLKQNEGDKEQ